MVQVSERVVLAQKAYILFYIKTPTNGHSHLSDATKQSAQPTTNGIASERQAQPASIQAAQTGSQQSAQPNEQKLHAKAGQSALKTDPPVVYGPHQLPTATSPKHSVKHTLGASSKVASTALVGVALENGISHDKAPDTIVSKAHQQQAAVFGNAVPSGILPDKTPQNQAAAAAAAAQSKQQPPQSELEPTVASPQLHPHELSQTAPLHLQQIANGASTNQADVAQLLLRHPVQLPKQQPVDCASQQARDVLDAKLQKQQSDNGHVPRQAAQALDTRQARKRKPVPQAEVKCLQQTTGGGIADTGVKSEQTTQKVKRRKQDRHLADADGPTGPRMRIAGSVSEQQAGHAEPADQSRFAAYSTSEHTVVVYASNDVFVCSHWHLCKPSSLLTSCCCSCHCIDCTRVV